MSHPRALFAATVFLAAFLLFLVEPIAAKQLLPVLGGSASVWITCLVFFQTTLLIGYLYAHAFARHSRRWMHVLLLIVATGAAVLWAARPLTAANGAEHPVMTVFGALSISIGLPFLLLAATSPLLQVIWARSESGGVPYWLYALSNLASLLALGLYPSVVEPHLTLRAQRIAWCAGFAVFAAVSTVLVRGAGPQPHTALEDEDESVPRASLAHKLFWVLLPMGAAMQLSAVTMHLTANIAAIPLLWILPLAAYLLTLIIVFQFPRLRTRGVLVRVLVLVLASVAYMLVNVDHTWPLWLSIPLFLISLFVACLFCHAEAYALRPRRVSETTLFYLLFAAGGALGSFLIGVAAPMIFRFNFDLPITYLVTAFLALAVTWRGHWSQRLLWIAASGATFAVVMLVRIAYQHDTMAAVRNFYGALRVKQDEFSYPGATVRTLLNGSIQHGTQIFGTEELRHTPTTYYALDSGVGLALRNCCEGRRRRIGVIGLGAGTIAAYGRPGDSIRFYEINPADVPIARNAFTYMRDSGAAISIVEGDARTSLASEAPQQFDVLVVDAFSGDAIPLHLLTREAQALYRHHLAPGGVIAFHISNQHVNLGPPIARLAQAAGIQARRVSSLSNDTRGEFTATWMLVSDNEAFFDQPDVAAHARPLNVDPHARVWTDDYSALLPVLRW